MTNELMGQDRFEVHFEWQVLSPLHVGSGGWLELDSDTELKEQPFSAALVMDAQENRRPTLPGAGLKGALRARALQSTLEPAVVDSLFGAVNPPSEELTELSTRPGRVEFRRAVWHSGADPTVEVRTAIDRDTLTVVQGKLFHADLIPAGTRFTSVLVLPKAVAAEAATLIRLLSSCTAQEPLLMGGGTRAGAGRVAVVESSIRLLHTDTTALARWLASPAASDGSFAPCPSQTVTGPSLQAWLAKASTTALGRRGEAKASLKLTLAFEGPFAVRDPRYKQPGPGTANSQPLGWKSNRALLPGTSLLGSLRSHAERICETLRQAGQAPIRNPAQGRPGKVPADLVHLLFGWEGWRGLVGVTADFVSTGPCTRIEQHMVALCRITGGGRDSAKFQLGCWVEPELEGELTLDIKRLKQAGIGEAQRHAALGLLHLLLLDLSCGDIGFGMARSKGWGWVKPMPDLSVMAEQAWFRHAVAEAKPELYRRCLKALHAHFGIPDTWARPMPMKAPASQANTPSATGDLGTLPTLERTAGSGAHFHNPYHFLPFARLRLPPQAQAEGSVAQQAREGGHSHALYAADRLTGALTVELETVTPLFVGGGRGEDTRADRPVVVAPFLWKGIHAIPGTSLRGMLSQVLEPMSGSAMRVLDADRSLSARASTRNAADMKRGVIRDAIDEEDNPALAVEDEDGNFLAIPEHASRALYQLADERWHDKGEKLTASAIAESIDAGRRLLQAKQTRTHLPPPIRSTLERARNKLYVPAAERQGNGMAKGSKLELLPAIDWEGRDECVLPRNPEPATLGTRARLMPGQIVYFRPNPSGEYVDEIAWSAIYRRTAWMEHRTNAGPLTLGRQVADSDPNHLPLGLRPAGLQLQAAEWLLGVVEQRSKGASEEGAVAFASKLSVTMARPVNGGPVRQLAAIPLKELSSPKPPSPSLYLTRRDGGESAFGKDEYLDRPHEYRLQGTKVYLHAQRENGQPVALDVEGKRGGPLARPPWQSARGADRAIADFGLTNRQVEVAPIASQERFLFQVRFTNLSAGELAMLCAAIQPSASFEHRLGMGRPIGLGSVKLSLQKLELKNVWQRYSQGEPAIEAVSDPHGWATAGVQALREADPGFHKSLLLLGEPEHVRAPVHYPQVINQTRLPTGQADLAPKTRKLIEDRNFEWWVANDKQRSQRQMLRPVVPRVRKPDSALPRVKR